MKIKKFAVLCGLYLGTLSYTYAADIILTNNTPYDGTGYINFSPCSSVAGDNGILKHGQSLTVPQSVISTFCFLSFSCEARVFMTNDCSGKEVARAKLDKDKGITSIENLDKEHFVITGGGTNVTISSVSRGWRDWFSWIF